MAQEFMQCRDGLWAVDWGLIRRIVRSRHLAVFQSTMGEIKEEKESFRVLGIPVASLPTWKHYAVDWDKVRANADAATEITLQGIVETAQTTGMRSVLRQLQNHLSETRDHKKKFFDKLRHAQQETMEGIEQAVESAKIGQEALTTVRDGSFTVVGVLAAATLGPAGQALTGGLTEAVIKLSDGGSAGEVGLAFVANMGISAVPFVEQGGKYIKLAVKTTMQVGYAAAQAQIQGKDVGEPILDAIGKAGIGLAADKLMEVEGFKRMIYHTAYPFACKVLPQKDFATNIHARLKPYKVANEAVKKGIEKVGELGKDAIKDRIKEKGGSGGESSAPADARAIDRTKTNVILTDDLLLTLAISGPAQSRMGPPRIA